MSYGGHYGGGSNGRSNHDNNRDRDRDNSRPERSERNDRNERTDRNERNDRSYNSRYGNSQKRYGQQSSNYGEHGSSSNYRRQDGGRDFYGYRNGYSRQDGPDRPQGAANNGQSNARRRDRNSQYDSYQGSKYRPVSGKPKGPGHGQAQPQSQPQSQAHMPQPISFRNNNGNSRLDEASSNDAMEERRSINRKQDWDASMHAKARPTQLRVPAGPRDQYKPEGRLASFPAKTHTKVDFEAGSGHSSEPLAQGLRTLKQDEQATREIVSKSSAPSTQSSRRNSTVQSKPIGAVNTEVTPGKEETQYETRPQEGLEPKTPTRPEVSFTGSKNIAKTVTSSAGPSSDLPSAQPSQDTSVSLDSEVKRDRLSRMFDDDEEEDVKFSDSESAEKQPQEQTIEKPIQQDIPGSPSSTGFDTSMLSPVGSTGSDDAFVQTLNIIPETRAENQNKSAADNMDLSEAETVIDDRSLNMSRSRSFLRKRGRDTFRERAKRRNVVYSEEEEEQEQEQDQDQDQEDDEVDYTSDGSDVPNDLDSIAKDTDGESDNQMIPVVGAPSQAKDGLVDSAQTPKSIPSAPEESKSKKEVGSAVSKRSSVPPYKIKRDSTGRSQLQRACKKGDLQGVKNLISKGASANESDFGGFTCLHEAALAGHTKIVEFLIENGADVNKQALEAGDFETPLMDAAENKHVDTVKALLKNGADPHLCNNEGYSTITKLFHLQEDDDEYEEVIKVINDFAPPEINSELSKVTHTPREIIEDPSDGYFSDLVKKKSKSLIYKYAAQGNKESAAEDFITHSLSLSKMPDVLNLAARNGHVELVDILLGLNPGHFDINSANKIGVTALLATVGRGYYEVVKFLLSRGADPRIRRVKDGLNALEIAKHSAQYDPREVVVLEESMNVTRGIKDSKSIMPTIKDSEIKAEQEQEPPKTRNTTTSAAPKLVETASGHAQKTVSTKSSTIDSTEIYPSGDEKNIHIPIKKSQADENSAIKSGESLNSSGPTKRRMSYDESRAQKKVKSDIFDEVADEEQKEDKPADLPETKLEDPNQDETAPHYKSHEHSELEISKSPIASSTLVSPPLSTKAQEEQRLRAAEQAKIWQEKVQAKKKARKEMFLLAEKEKEKRRREEEEERLKLLKKQEEQEREQRMREEIEAKKLAQELAKKKQIMEHQIMLQNYPIGLQDAAFDGSFKRENSLKYSPLYVFNFDNEKWVIDMQIALILSISVSTVHSIVGGIVGPQVDSSSKDKLWSLFFKMIGVGRNNVIERNGMEKFRCLQLRYVRLSQLSDWLKSENYEAYQILWTENRLTTVDLSSLESAKDIGVKTQSNGFIRGADVGFIPPKFRHREDVLKTIQTANSPLW